MDRHSFLARTRSPVPDCKWCGKPFGDAIHVKEKPYVPWETRADWAEEDRKRARHGR